MIRRLDGSYLLVELERPDQQLGTLRGRPSQNLTQPAFQIGEWVAYIGDHYELLREKYPGLNDPKNRTSVIVMSRATRNKLGPEQRLRDQIRVWKQTFAVDHIWLYDDLIVRAEHAVALLSGLTPTLSPDRAAGPPPPRPEGTGIV